MFPLCFLSFYHLMTVPRQDEIFWVFSLCINHEILRKEKKEEREKKEIQRGGNVLVSGKKVRQTETNCLSLQEGS